VRRSLTAPLLLAALAVTSACATSGGSDTTASAPSGVPSSSSSGTPAAELRLGYFPNVTHATAVYGVAEGVFAEQLGGTKLTTQTFNAGPAAIEALFAGAIDATYIGPSPTINGFIKSNGEALRVVAGATSGGASLVVKPEITDVSQLKGKKIASPQTGNTQDIALRHFLDGKGFEVDERGAGDVTIIAQENAQTLTTFQAGQVDGAWVPEPWASRLVLEGGAKVLVNEKDLWPGGEFVTTHLVVRTEFLRDHPQTVEALIEGSVAANKAIEADKEAAKKIINTALGDLTGKPLKPETIDRAFTELTLTDDPAAASLKTSSEHSFATGLVKQADLKGIYDLTLLRKVLGTSVDDAGLGGS
jgi:NitT/TauT family transport system substrate-binding protein